MYVLVEFAGKQFRLEEGDSIQVPYIDDKVGSKVIIDKILYMDDGKNKTIGNPLIKGAKIEAKIESHVRGRKVVVFKFKRRKGYQNKNTHRQEYSVLKVGKLGKLNKSTSKKVETKTPGTKTVPKKTATMKKNATKNTAANKKEVKKTAAKKTSQVKPKETKE